MSIRLRILGYSAFVLSLFLVASSGLEAQQDGFLFKLKFGHGMEGAPFVPLPPDWESWDAEERESFRALLVSSISAAGELINRDALRGGFRGLLVSSPQSLMEADDTSLGVMSSSRPWDIHLSGDGLIALGSLSLGPRTLKSFATQASTSEARGPTHFLEYGDLQS